MMGKYVDYYCSDNNKKLIPICDKQLRRFYSLSQADYDDFYSIGATTVWDCEKRFDESKCDTFEPFLIGCIKRKFMTEMTARGRDKRTDKIEVVDEDTGEIKKMPISNISIETPIGDGKYTIGDTIPDDISVDGCEFKNVQGNIGKKLEMYLNGLSDLQRKIAEMIMRNFDVDEIKAKLNLTDRQYAEAWKTMTSYENKRIIRQENQFGEDETMNAVISTEDMAETYKNTSYSIESISKQLQKKRIRDDHILQRYSGQWQRFAKSDLVSCVLRGKSLTQIIISEEIKDGLRMQWLIDGKQRCTTLDDYLHDGFAISKNIKNYNIKYQTAKIDNSGNEVVNEDGFTEMEFKEYDIRGKKFSQLPEELQDVFKDRQIPVLYNTNCTKKDIADDIARFNRSKPMNKAQNGWLGLEEGFAELADNIAKMKFFLPEFKGTSYTTSNKNTSAIRRVIIEGITVSDFIEDYNPDFNKMCEYLTEEASDSNFTEFYSLIERLTEVCNENVSSMFGVKDSFLWLGLFSRFSSLNVIDSKFIDFMAAFKESIILADKSDFSGMLTEDDYNIYAARNTKDRSMVKRKMELLEKLMFEYLHISKEDVDVDDVPTLDFVKENVSEDTVYEDVEFYETLLEDLSLSVDNSTKLLEEKNHNSLIGIVAYSVKADIDLDVWFIDYFERNTGYIINQKQNYIAMKNDLENFITSKGSISA